MITHPMIIQSNFVPYAKQMEIINGILSTPQKYHVVAKSRQTGLTLTGLNLLLYYAINQPNSYNVLVSPIFAQSKKSFGDLASAAGDSNPIIRSANHSDLIMTFSNGSIIRMVSAESKNNLRGFTVSGILIIDEAAYIQEEIWTEVLRPATMILGKKVLFISTPNGPNWFKSLHELGLNKEFPDWRSYRITSKDNPYLDPKELEMARITLPDKAFQQEYLGIFTEGGGSVFDFSKNAIIQELPKGPAKGVKYFGGLDLAISKDYTVLTILDQSGNLVDFFRENNTSWEQIIYKVSEKIKKWGAYTLVEKNSIGSVVYEQLQKLCGNNLIGEFWTSQDSKNDIIEDLKLSFAKGALFIPKRDKLSILYDELSMFSYKMLPSGKISYSAPSGGTDDCVMSLAFANHGLVNKKAKGTYAIYSAPK